MTSDSNGKEPAPVDNHISHTDKVGPKLVDATNKVHDKATKGKDSDKQEPAGGYDDTSFPKAAPGYTLKFTFHSAENLPFADLTLTSDPYIIATLKTDVPKRHKQDPDIALRTPTIHRNVNPQWNTEWIIAHMPSSGFNMKLRLYDEDPTDHDDRLGNVHVNVSGISEGWKGIKQQKYEIKKRMGSKRAYTLRGCTALLSRSVKMSGTVTLSIENLGKSEGEGGRPYTIAPLAWSQHFSPLMGRLTGVKDGGSDGDKKAAKYNFQAIQMQLRGPVPEHMYHRYVEFKPFVAGMFTSHSLRGRILNHALHHQHARIYNYDKSTKYGKFEKPSNEMTKRLLEFVHYDQGGRIFTYVITLDGQFRFTETGKEFGIDMLSKHTMHSDVNIYIAFSGEFFIRRLKHPYKDGHVNEEEFGEVLPPSDEPKGEKDTNEKSGVNESDGSAKPQKSNSSRKHSEALSTNLAVAKNGEHNSGRQHSFSSKKSHERSHSQASKRPSTAQNSKPVSNDSSKDPSQFELIIDNDSGTYRPNAKYLPTLKKFLRSNFPGLKVVTLDCQGDEEKMKKLKGEQVERKKSSGKQITYMQNSSVDSFSSSDEEELERKAAGGPVGTTGRIKSEMKKVKTKFTGIEDEEAEKEEKQTVKDGERAANAIERGDDSVDKNGNSDLSTATTSQSAHQIHNQEAHSSNYNKEKSNSVSTDADHASFNTAYTNGVPTEHFVTPKPSLGDGGLNQFDYDATPKPDDHRKLEIGGVHHAVTSAP